MASEETKRKLKTAGAVTAAGAFLVASQYARIRNNAVDGVRQAAQQMYSVINVYNERRSDEIVVQAQDVMDQWRDQKMDTAAILNLSLRDPIYEVRKPQTLFEEVIVADATYAPLAERMLSEGARVQSTEPIIWLIQEVGKDKYRASIEKPNSHFASDPTSDLKYHRLMLQELKKCQPDMVSAAEREMDESSKRLRKAMQERKGPSRELDR